MQEITYFFVRLVSSKIFEIWKKHTSAELAKNFVLALLLLTEISARNVQCLK